MFNGVLLHIQLAAFSDGQEAVFLTAADICAVKALTGANCFLARSGAYVIGINRGA
jgi:hypothetical protein